MDRPIAVGDLVQVVRGMGCCGALYGSEGKIFTVTSFEPVSGHCRTCKFRPLPMAAHGLIGNKAITVDRLKRIPPLSELEGTKTDEPLKVVA